MVLQGVAMNLNDANKLPEAELGTVPRFGSADDAKAYLTQQGVKYVLAQFVDIHGVAKAKSVPVAHLKSVLTEGAGFAGFAIWHRTERSGLHGGG
jgi:glutamine synthetase